MTATRVMSMVSIADRLPGRRAGGAGGRPERDPRRSCRSISAAAVAVAALAGCASGHPVATVTVTVTSTATSGQSSAPVSDGSGAVCVTSAAKGLCGPYRYAAITHSDGQNTVVGQNVWNPIPGWSQTLHATTPGNWWVTANMPAGNTAVVSFPNTGQEYYYTNTLAGFSSIYAFFTEDMHPTSKTSAEAAFDIWLNNWHNEVMIQNDIVNRGTCPVSASATFGGSGGVPVQHWNLCKYGKELIWQLNGQGERSSTVDILAMLRWLVSHSYLPHGSGLTDISYGFEICSTGGQQEIFTLSRFSIHST